MKDGSRDWPCSRRPSTFSPCKSCLIPLTPLRQVSSRSIRTYGWDAVRACRGSSKGRADPLALHKVPFLTYLPSLLTLQLKWATAGAALKLPLHVSVGGKDQVVDSAATKRFYERIAAQVAENLAAMGRSLSHTVLGSGDAGTRGGVGAMGDDVSAQWIGEIQRVAPAMTQITA